LHKYLINNNIKIELETECIDIRKQNNQNNYECITSSINSSDKENKENKETTKFAKNIILAMPKLNLLKINFLKNIRNSLLNTVLTKPFMRMYAIFPLDKNNKPWFDDLNTTTTTDTILRQVIPIDKKHGLVMIYVDDGTAKTWFYLKQKKYLKSELLFHLRRVFNDKDIPKPTRIISHYCNTATHVWKPSVDSNKLNKKVLKPYKTENIYIIGEAYSTTQEWMEGALTSTNNLIDLLQSK